MADATENLTVQLIVKGTGQGQKQLKEFADGSEKSSKALNKLDKALGVARNALVAFGAVKVAGELFKLVDSAAKSEQIMKGFSRSFGDAEKNLNKLRVASKGTIADFDLMQSANKAALLGITSNVEDLAGLMQTARLRGRELGLDTTQAFDDIVTGIGRKSPLILDNLGIKIPDAIKETMKNMSEAEQTATLLRFAIEDGAKIAKQYGNEQLTSAEKIQKMRAQVENLKVEIGEKMTPIVLKGLELVTGVVDRLADAFSGMQGDISNVQDAVMQFGGVASTALGIDTLDIGAKLDNLVKTFKDRFEELVLEAAIAGVQIAKNLAPGTLGDEQFDAAISMYQDRIDELKTTISQADIESETRLKAMKGAFAGIIPNQDDLDQFGLFWDGLMRRAENAGLSIEDFAGISQESFQAYFNEAGTATGAQQGLIDKIEESKKKLLANKDTAASITGPMQSNIDLIANAVKDKLVFNLDNAIARAKSLPGAIEGGIRGSLLNMSNAGLLQSGRGEARKKLEGKADGGIVGGSSTTGDRMLIRANSKEMVLTQADQSNLLKMIRGGDTRTTNFNAPINFGGNTNPMQQMNVFNQLLMNAYR